MGQNWKKAHSSSKLLWGAAANRQQARATTRAVDNSGWAKHPGRGGLSAFIKFILVCFYVSLYTLPLKPKLEIPEHPAFCAGILSWASCGMPLLSRPDVLWRQFSPPDQLCLFHLCQETRALCMCVCAGDRTQGFTPARQVFYNKRHLQPQYATGKLTCRKWIHS